MHCYFGSIPKLLQMGVFAFWSAVTACLCVSVRLSPSCMLYELYDLRAGKPACKTYGLEAQTGVTASHARG